MNFCKKKASFIFVLILFSFSLDAVATYTAYRTAGEGCGWQFVVDSSDRLWLVNAQSRQTKHIQPLDGKKVRQVSCGLEHFLALTGDGTVYAWGKNTDGQLGDGTFEDAFTPRLVNKLAHAFIVEVFAEGYCSAARSKENVLYFFGDKNCASMLK